MPTPIVSLFTENIQATVMTDRLAPKPPILTLLKVSQVQNVAGDPGHSVFEINWNIPTQNETVTQLLSELATGAAQDLESAYDHFPAADVYEVTNIAGTPVVTTTVPARGDAYITLFNADAATLATGDMLIVNGPSWDQTYLYKIVAIDTGDTESVVTFESRLQYVTGAAMAFAKCTATWKTPNADFVIESTEQGLFSLVAGAFSAGSGVAVHYAPTLADLNKFEIFALPTAAVPTRTDYTNISTSGSAVRIKVPGSDPVSYVFPNTTSSITGITESELTNGTSYTFFVFAYDNETSVNYSAPFQAVVETLPGVPQGVSKMASANSVTITLPDPATCGPACSGFNVYRCDLAQPGDPWVAANAKLLNTSVVSASTFEDSASNTTNRVDVLTVAAPANGSSYIYRVEAQISASSYTVGNANQSSGVPAVTYAELNAFVTPGQDANTNFAI